MICMQCKELTYLHLQTINCFNNFTEANLYKSVLLSLFIDTGRIGQTADCKHKRVVYCNTCSITQLFHTPYTHYVIHKMIL